MKDIILEIGDLAYFDSVFNGLVPIKLMGIEESPFLVEYLVRTTCQWGTYPNHEYFKITKNSIVPRNMVKRRKYGTYIMPHHLTIIDMED